MQMEPSGSIAKFLPQIHKKISEKNTFTCHNITKEFGGDTSKLFHTFAAANLTAVEIFLGHPLLIKNAKRILSGRN